MATIRTFTSPPPWYAEETRKPPFFVERQDVDQLVSCEAFKRISDSLADQEHGRFCDVHESANKQEEETWLLERDVIYALIFPLLEIYHHASKLAMSMLGNKDSRDPELLFRGEGRGAFTWLQCFIATEEEWCCGKGCPGCIVSYVLQAEPTVRLVLTACRLARSLRKSHESLFHLPIFDFWMASLRSALDRDEFWGPKSWKSIKLRASNLERGIYQMALQCCELEKLAQGFPAMSPTRTCAIPTKLGTYKRVGGKNIFVGEESDWMQNIVLACWHTVLTDAAENQRIPDPAGTLISLTSVGPCCLRMEDCGTLALTRNLMQGSLDIYPESCEQLSGW